jgi:hypothetical protein
MEFRGIPSDSVQFRIRNRIAELLAYSKCEGVGVSEEFRMRNQFRRFWNSWELIATIPELNGTELDAIPESEELIPGAESIPQCSTSRNRMYSRH